MTTATPHEPGRLIDAKFPCPDLPEFARRLATQQATYIGLLQQTDFYFPSAHGTLKLRQSASTLPGATQPTASSAALIAYWRDRHGTEQTCTYYDAPQPDAASCSAGLAATLGSRIVISKRRQVWTLHGSEVHLDDVDGVGLFVEIETPYAAGQAAHDRCRAALGLADAQPVPHSYLDLAEIDGRS